MKTARKIISVLLAVTLLIALCTACTTQTTTSGETSASQATSGTTADVFKSVKIGVSYDPTTLDPAEANLDTAYDIAHMIYEPLLVDISGEIMAGSAETWSSSEDSKVWTFTIRDATYSDGSSFDANDIYYAIMRIIDPEAGHYNSSGLLDIVNASAYMEGSISAEEVGIKVLDDKTLEMTFNIPMFETTFTNFYFSPMDAGLSDSVGIEYGTAADKILGNGPFVVTDWASDSSVTLVKNDNYWNADNIEMDEVTFLVGAAGADTAVDMMMTGDVDVTYFTTMNQVQALINEGYDYNSITTSYRCLNVNHLGSTEDMTPFMSNVNFRKALNLAIDRENLTASVLTTDQAAFRLTAPSELGVAISFNEEYPYDAWPTTADPVMAKQYLQTALDELGKTIEDVPPIVLLCYESESSVTILSAVQDMLLQNLGLTSEISPQTIQNMIAMAFGGQYDLWLGGAGTTTPDWLVGFAYGYHSDSYAQTPLLRGYTSEAFDTLYDKAANSTSYELRKDNLFEVEKFMCDNIVNIIMSWTNTYYVSSPDIQNIVYRADGNPYYAALDMAQ